MLTAVNYCDSARIDWRLARRAEGFPGVCPLNDLSYAGVNIYIERLLSLGPYLKWSGRVEERPPNATEPW